MADELKTILLVDDMAVYREPVAMALRGQGYAVVDAANGREAISAVRSRAPDLILLDLSMPVMSGMDFLRERIGDPSLKKIPVIIVTIDADKNSIVSAARLGVRDYLLKSRLSLNELFTRIAARLGAAAPAPAPAVQSTDRAREMKPPSGPHRLTGPPTPLQSTLTTVALPVSQTTTSVDRLKSIQPLLTREQIETHIQQCGDIKALSPAVSQVLHLTGAANGSLDQVVRAIRQDQALALKILKLANSVVYTRGEPVESVHKAVTRIGMSQIRQAALNISVVDQYCGSDLGERLNSFQFWEHSIACGLIASEIARCRGGTPTDIDTTFTMGLLHDVGRIAYAQQLGEVYLSVLKTAEELQLPLEQVESRMIQVNHADMMERLLVAWRFPKDLIGPIAMHHLSIGNIRQMAPSMIGPVATLSLANALAHALLLGGSGNMAIYPTQELIRGLKLGPEAIGEIVAKIPEQTQDLKFAMLSRSPAQPWRTLAEIVCGEVGAPLRPIFVSADPEIDAFAILLSRLRGADEEPPNIGVVHLQHERERIALTEQLRKAEAGAGVEPLPLIIISPSGTLSLEESAVSGRRVAMLSRPITLPRLAAAARELLAG